MKARTPEEAGFPLGEPLEPLGRARCFSVRGVASASLLRLDAGDEVRRAFRWGMARGVGGFIAAGEDSEGLWFVRKRAGKSLDRLLKEAPPPVVALSVFARLARLLEQCENKKIFVGPLLPDQIEISEGGDVILIADEWVARALGRAPSSPSPEPRRLRFFPAPQASGAPWDAAANRYTFGLLLYEALAGEPAFAGQGLRSSLEQRSERAPSAFSVERSRALPPGVQSLCLSLLDPDVSKRPRSAQEIARELARVQGARVAEPPAPSGESTSLGATPEPRDPARLERAPRVTARVFLLAGALLSTLLAIVSARGAKESPEPRVGARAPLAATATAASCESCHPRHASEWQSSVMAHAATSPLFQALEQLITEQVGRSRDCPDGAGILRPAGALACRDRDSGLVVTGSGGEGWCSNCHLPKLSLAGGGVPVFRALEPGSSAQQPLAELVPKAALEGIACTVCHQAERPVSSRAGAGEYTGNAFWISSKTGLRFDFRPEARSGLEGIANSGASLNSAIFSAVRGALDEALVPSGAHLRTSERARVYQRSSEFCGSCHDVRLFGTDVLGRSRGEHFKRLRNAYSEWAEWRDERRRRGAAVASCVDCHLSTFPGICAPAPGASGERGCPPGTRFEPRAPGSVAEGFVATNSERPAAHHPHYFTGVEVPLDPRAELDEEAASALDLASLPVDPRARRDLLLASALALEIEPIERRGSRLDVPVRIENVGAGHRVPAGFSQERELWVELTVRDANGRLLYQVGKISRPDEDLRDKIFARVGVDDRSLDAEGRPLGLFGADVGDGPDVPRWSPSPELGGARFRGRGLINFQNGFLRCVRCIGRIDADGRCQPLPGQERFRAARFEDAPYDQDTGECDSNLRGREALFEVFFPVGALDARRGIVKAPDAIIDTRSLAPEQPVRYTYELDIGRAPGPIAVEARLLFRAFPPFLLRAFIEYERRKSAEGRRPSGPLIDERALERLDVVEVRRASRAGGAA
jgi:hypothetical protein